MAGQRNITFQCRCGKVAGHILGTHPDDGMHLACHCPDCAAADRHFGKPDPGTEGVEIYWASPDALVIEKGADTIEALCLTEEPRLLRWYASCCDTPLFNTQPTRSIFLIGMHADVLPEDLDLGPVAARAFVPKPGGGATHQGAFKMMRFVLGQTLGAHLRRKMARHPLFDPKTRAPIRTPTPLTPKERAAAGLN